MDDISKFSEQRVTEVNTRNSERKQERESALNVLASGSANEQLSEIAKQGGSVGRRIEREIRRFQQTGRVSSWLAGETLKAEAAQNAAQQSAFNRKVSEAISTPLPSIQVGPDGPTIKSRIQIEEKIQFPTFGYVIDVCVNGEPHTMNIATYGPPFKPEEE